MLLRRPSGFVDQVASRNMLRVLRWTRANGQLRLQSATSCALERRFHRRSNAHSYSVSATAITSHAWLPIALTELPKVSRTRRQHPQHRRQIYEPPCHEMHDNAFALDLAVDTHQPRAEK